MFLDVFSSRNSLLSGHRRQVFKIDIVIRLRAHRVEVGKDDSESGNEKRQNDGQRTERRRLSRRRRLHSGHRRRDLFVVIGGLKLMQLRL